VRELSILRFLELLCRGTEQGGVHAQQGEEGEIGKCLTRAATDSASAPKRRDVERVARGKTLLLFREVGKRKALVCRRGLYREIRIQSAGTRTPTRRGMSAELVEGINASQTFRQGVKDLPPLAEQANDV